MKPPLKLLRNTAGVRSNYRLAKKLNEQLKPNKMHKRAHSRPSFKKKEKSLHVKVKYLSLFPEKKPIVSGYQFFKKNWSPALKCRSILTNYK
mmetsp:Transcript_23288/g.20661  ORF Transcript_23288/g.20661 Transcript_23288/m.20661 type:complete len:92 (-) Transcript_23288:22-297(-)